MTLGERIKAERLKKGWTQAELAHRTDVSDGTISRLERDERIASTQIKLRILVALGLIQRRRKATFGERLNWWRNHQGLTRRELETKSGVSYTEIKHYEDTYLVPDRETFKKLVAGLGITARCFFEKEMFV